MLGVIPLIISFVVPFDNVQAASFDCNKASKLEKHICSDPALSKADE